MFFYQEWGPRLPPRACYNSGAMASSSRPTPRAAHAALAFGPRQPAFGRPATEDGAVRDGAAEDRQVDGWGAARPTTRTAPVAMVRRRRRPR